MNMKLFQIYVFDILYILNFIEVRPITSEWMAMKRRRASLILSTSILLELSPDAIFNSLLESGIKLPVSEFTYSLGENTPKTIETLIGPPLKNLDEAVDAIGKFIRNQKYRVIQDNIEKTESKNKPKTPEKPLKLTTAELLKQGLDEYEKNLAKESKNKQSEDLKPSKKSDQSEKAKKEYKTPKTKIKKDEL